jgi:hypothetical protein
MAAIEGDALRDIPDGHGVLYPSIVSADSGNGIVEVIRDPNFSAVECHEVGRTAYPYSPEQ